MIALPPNLFYGTSIAVNILVLSKGKSDASTQFIDASGEKFYKKETNNNILLDEHIDHILQIFEKKEEEKYVATSLTTVRLPKTITISPSAPMLKQKINVRLLISKAQCRGGTDRKAH